MVDCRDFVPGGKLNRACLVPSQSCTISDPDIETFSFDCLVWDMGFSLCTEREEKHSLGADSSILTEQILLSLC